MCCAVGIFSPANCNYTVASIDLAAEIKRVVDRDDCKKVTDEL